jgi:elongator complex protein 2
VKIFNQLNPEKAFLRFNET